MFIENKFYSKLSQLFSSFFGHMVTLIFFFRILQVLAFAQRRKASLVLLGEKRKGKKNSIIIKILS